MAICDEIGRIGGELSREVGATYRAGKLDIPEVIPAVELIPGGERVKLRGTIRGEAQALAIADLGDPFWSRHADLAAVD
jgi:hypothetical protein